MSNEPRAGMGIDPEMLAAYIDKRLSPEQRAAVEAQLAADPDSYAVLLETIKTLDSLPADKKTPSARAWVIAGLVAAAAVALAVWLSPALLQRIRGERVDPRFERLVAAVGDQRYVEARLSGGFAYGALKPVTRGDQATPASNLSLVAAAGELQQAAGRDPSAGNLHAWGVAQVLLGQYDGAIESLLAAAQASADRRVLSDLAAAYVSRAIATSRAGDWPSALATASRAIEGADPPPAEALFNRALAAEALNLTSVARDAWTAYLAVETDSQWRAEAERHVQRLNQKPQSWRSEQPAVLTAAMAGDQPRIDDAISKYPQKVRESVEDDLLRRWADEQSRGDAAADQTLSVAIRLADALAARTGDDLLARSAHAIESLGVADRAQAAVGVLRYAAGRDAYERAAMQDSVAPFSEARTVLVRYQVPLAEWCELYLATASYYRNDYPAALAVVSAALRRTSANAFHALTARMVWLQGLIATQQAEYDRSLAFYSRALQLFERTGEMENQAAVHSLLATAFLYVGDDDNVWAHTVRSLQNRSADSAYRRQHMILVGAANRAARLDLPEAALAFADEAAAVNRQWDDAIARVEISNYRSRALVQLHRPAEAKEEVTGARQSLNQIGDQGLRQRAAAEVMQTEAEVLGAVDPQAGIEAASRAIEFFSGSRSVLRVPRLYAARASARKRAGDADGALADLQAGAARFDAERATLPRSERLRLAYSDEVWNTYRQLVGAEVDRGAPCETVLAAAERARAATLSSSPVSNDRLTEIGDPRTAIVSFTFSDDRLIIVGVRAGRCEYRVSNLSLGAAKSAIAAFQAELSRPGGGIANDASSVTLFRQLLRPVWPLLDGSDRLEIVADGPLHYLPFAALRIDGGKLLIEVAAIRMIPSLSAGTRPGGDVRHAMVSSGGSLRSLDLPPLPGVKEEVATVTRALTAARVATEPANDASSFVDGLRRVDVVHFAGHAVINQDYPLLSKLILEGPDADAWITAERIAAMAPIAPRLVFLSACSTQAGRLFGGEGPASLARSFLAAGATEVVASLWPVTDTTAPALVSSFYTHWSKTGDAAEALREAMLADLRAGAGTSRQWAAWVVVGRRSVQSRSVNPSTH